jgi:hypothetical protein
LTEIKREIQLRIAATLASALADDGWWALTEQASRSDSARAQLAERALSLYRSTQDVIRTRLAEPASEIDRAVGILRDIADAAAILSYDWDDAAQYRYAPTRAVIELEVGLYGIDAWAARLGTTIRARGSDSVPEEVWNADATVDASSEPPIDFAVYFSQMVDAYDAILDLDQNADERDALTRPEAREWACEGIIASRSVLVWARVNMPEFEIAAAALRFAAQASYAITHGRSPALGVFPSRADLVHMLRGSHALDSLLSGEHPLPEWLTDA